QSSVASAKASMRFWLISIHLETVSCPISPGRSLGLAMVFPLLFPDRLARLRGVRPESFVRRGSPRKTPFDDLAEQGRIDIAARQYDGRCHVLGRELADQERGQGHGSARLVHQLQMPEG